MRDILQAGYILAKSAAPMAMAAMAKIQKLNDKDIGTYRWTLPDGFKVQYDVKSNTLIKAERITSE